MVRVRYYTFGCKVNQYDTELLRETMAAYGWEPVVNFQEAEVALINSCAVTAEAERKCRQLVRRLHRDSPSLIIYLTGCSVQRNRAELAGLVPGLFFLDPPLPNPDNLVNLTLPDGQRVKVNLVSGITSFFNHSRAFLKVQDGCAGGCSYCVVPHLRQRFYSRTPANIQAEIRNLVAAGYKEIVLCGVRLGHYQTIDSDGTGWKLEQLLSSLLALAGEFRLRLSSLEITDITPGIVELIAANPGRFCPHLHIPLQSAADTVLQRMRRPYTQTVFAQKIKEIRDILPDIALTTDVLVGFPGETLSDFQITRQFLKETEFSRLHIFPFSRRPGTPAAELDQSVPSNSQTKNRVKELLNLDRELRLGYARRFCGQKRPVLVRRNGRDGLTDNYIQVKIKNSSDPDFTLLLDNTSNLSGRITGERVKELDISSLAGRIFSGELREERGQIFVSI